jgi:hypothetical protein
MSLKNSKQLKRKHKMILLYVKQGIAYLFHLELISMTSFHNSNDSHDNLIFMIIVTLMIIMIQDDDFYTINKVNI